MRSAVHKWIAAHDDRWSFVLLYVGGAVLLSIYASLFWIIMLMLVHFGVEIWRHLILRVDNPVLHALWHVKLDIALVFFAVAIVLYSQMIIGILGIGQAARAGQALRGAQFVTRVAIVERGLRVFFLVADDFARVALSVWSFFRKKKSLAAAQTSGIEAMRERMNADEVKDHEGEPWKTPSVGDRFTLGFALISLCVVALAPAVIPGGVDQFFLILSQELTP